jgi:hypothetical protein
VDKHELRERWMAGAKDTARLMAVALHQEYRIHEGKWWLVSSGKLQRSLTLDEVIWNAKQDGLLPDRLYIIGGTVAEARVFAREQQIPPDKAAFIGGSRWIREKFRGTMNATVILCGRHYESITARDIYFLESDRFAVIYRAD